MKDQLFMALEELDDLLYTKFGGDVKVNLYIIGGAALLFNNTRSSLENKKTDIDYLGEDFDEYIKELIKKVGLKYNLGTSFLNNDLGPDALEHLEYVVGKLNFSYHSTLKWFNVFVLQDLDILKLKVYSLDTCIMARRDDDLSEFERAQDFPDISDIMRKLCLTLDEVKAHTQDFVICTNEVYSSIEAYINDGYNRYVKDIT